MTNEESWNKSDVVWKSANSLLGWRFLFHCRCFSFSIFTRESNQTLPCTMWLWRITGVTQNVIRRTPRSGHPSYQFNVWFLPRVFFGEDTTRLAPVPQDSKRALGYQDLMNADQLLNKKKHVSSFLQEIYRQNWPETRKYYFNVTNSTLLNKNLTFI